MQLYFDMFTHCDITKCVTQQINSSYTTQCVMYEIEIQMHTDTQTLMYLQ